MAEADSLGCSHRLATTRSSAGSSIPGPGRIARALIGVGLGLAALAAYELNGKRGELAPEPRPSFGHLHVFWLLVRDRRRTDLLRRLGPWLQRQLLVAGGPEMSFSSAFGLSLGAGAIANSLPGGTAFAALYSFRFYRRTGADATLAGWVLLATFVCSSLTLCILAAFGVILAFGQSSSFRTCRLDSHVLGPCGSRRRASSCNDAGSTE